MKKLSYFDFILVIVICFQIGLVECFDVDLLKWELAFVSIYTFIRAVCSFKDLLHPYVLFLFCFNIFLNSRVFIDIVTGKPFYYTTFFSKYPFSYATQQKILLMLIVSLICINLGRELALYFFPDKQIELKKNDKYLTISRFFMNIFFIPVILYFIQLGISLWNNGYGGIPVSVKESILSHATTFFQFGFYLFLASKPSKQMLKKYSFVFVLSMFLSMFSGVRNIFATNILMLLSYYSLYVKKISQIIVVIMISLGVIVFEVTGFIRDDPENANLAEYIFNNEDSVAEIFFSHQGVSITVLGYSDELLEKSSIMDLFYPMYDYYAEKFVDQYKEEEQKDYNFGHKISYNINPAFYYSGHGVGTSFVAELYSAGEFLGVMVGSFLLSFFLICYIYKYGNKTLGCLYLLIFLKYLYFMPRGGYFAFFSDVFKWYIVITVIGKVEKIAISRKGTTND